MNKIKTLNAKRLVAVFTAMLIAVLSLSYTGNKTNATNSSILYYVYDAKTAEKLYRQNYILTTLKSSDNSRSVIGTEDRKEEKDKQGVIKLITNYDETHCGLGSGFVVSDHVIATAAHCLYNDSGSPLTIAEILLFDNNGNVALHATPVEYHVPYLFTVPVNDVECYNYDYALISVKEDLSDYDCFYLGVPLESFKSKHATVNVTGFPGTIGKPGEEETVNTCTEHKMYTGKGTFLDMNEHKMSYSSDITPGNSGGPAYITEKSPQGDTYDTVISIATYGGEGYNGGVRITTDLIHFYSGNKNINW